MPSRRVKLKAVHANLFDDDVALLKKLAVERRSRWQVELRQLVHRALKAERAGIEFLKDD